jgi:hypothetical protein
MGINIQPNLPSLGKCNFLQDIGTRTVIVIDNADNKWEQQLLFELNLPVPGHSPLLQHPLPLELVTLADAVF